MSLISDNLQAVHSKILVAAQAAGRPASAVHLLAVSKTCSAEVVLEAARAGQRAFGENYLQEAIDKMHALQVLDANLQLEWHFIGPIQSNKTRPIAEHFAWVHSVDRLKIAQRLSEQRPSELPNLNICLQVNISDEDTKSGVAPDQALLLAREIATLPRLTLRGLMAVPEASNDAEQQHLPLRRMRALFDEVNRELASQGVVMDTLSMGMSGDLQAAVQEGSTMVRIGTAIFGERHYAK